MTSFLTVEQPQTICLFHFALCCSTCLQQQDCGLYYDFIDGWVWTHVCAAVMFAKVPKRVAKLLLSQWDNTFSYQSKLMLFWKIYILLLQLLEFCLHTPEVLQTTKLLLQSISSFLNKTVKLWNCRSRMPFKLSAVWPSVASQLAAA